ncbi:MAG: hypothetical protein QM804_15705 [Propionicimonas sp.]
MIAVKEERRRALEQPLLPRAVLVEYSAANLTHTVVALITEAAASTSPDIPDQRLSRIHLMRALSQALAALAITESRRAVREGQPLSVIANALAVSRQRVHQIVSTPKNRRS